MSTAAEEYKYYMPAIRKRIAFLREHSSYHYKAAVFYDRAELLALEWGLRKLEALQKAERDE